MTKVAKFECTLNLLFLEWGLGAWVNQLVGNKFNTKRELNN